jgi:AcrR family transcriptional regulator
MGSTSKARERILGVAGELFYARGIHAVGVDEIVARSGAAKTTLYAHFASKDELVAAYLLQWSLAWRDFVDAELAAANLAPAGQIDLVFKLLANACDDPSFRGCPYTNAAAEFPDPKHPARIVGVEHRGWIRALLERLARAANARDPEQLADWLCLLYDASMIGAQFDPQSGAAWKSRAAAAVLVESMTPRSGQENSCA